MINPVYLALVPLVHKLLYKQIKRGELHYLFPALYTAYTTYLAVNVKYELYGYTLSTVPVLADLHAPIILVIDPHALLFLYINSLLYFALTKYDLEALRRLLPLVSIVTLVFFSLDLLLSAAALIPIAVYGAINGERRLISYASISIVMFSVAFLFASTYNLGLIVAYSKFEGVYGVSALLLELGACAYFLSFSLMLFVAIQLKPIAGELNLDSWSRALLLLYSLAILMRLKPVVDVLFASLHSALKYSLAALASINVLSYSLLYLKTRREELVEYYELSYVPFALAPSTPFSYSVLVYAIVSYIAHRALVARGSRELALLSQAGFLPLLGGVSKALFFALIIRGLGLLPTIAPLIACAFTSITCLTAVDGRAWLRRSFYALLAASALLACSLLYIEPIGSILYEYPDQHYKIVFGV